MAKHTLPVFWAGLAALFLPLGLVACGGVGSVAKTPVAATTAGAKPLLVLTDSQVNAQGLEAFQVEAFQQGRERWAIPLPTSGDALAAADGVIYVGAGETIYALDAQSGHQRWQASVGPQVRSIHVIEARVYVDTGGGFSGQERIDVFSLMGHLLWQYTPPALQDIPAWLVDQGVFYTVEGDGGVSATLVARDAATGAARWRAPLQIDSLPQMLLPAGPDALLVVTQDALLMAERNAGGLLWQRQDTQAVGASITAGTLYAFFVDQPAALGEAAPVFLRALRVSDGRLLWQQPLAPNDAGFLSSGQPLSVGVITPQAAYLADSPDFTALHAWRLSDGTQRWRKTVVGGVVGLLADGQRVYLASSQQFVALQADTGQVIWRAANPDGLTALREEAGVLLGVNPQTFVLAGYDLASGQRVWRLTPVTLDAYLET
ncbi:MAG TPA: PQQ-binding-like beta-propeller repeat protein [Ktedonobacterales bacterium]|nr:PQQ-binding-like beta-propeller repeat protein [Ktedonobacterales bacterium]